MFRRERTHSACCEAGIVNLAEKPLRFCRRNHGSGLPGGRVRRAALALLGRRSTPPRQTSANPAEAKNQEALVAVNGQLVEVWRALRLLCYDLRA